MHYIFFGEAFGLKSNSIKYINGGVAHVFFLTVKLTMVENLTK